LNLPQLTALIGEQIKNSMGTKNELAMLVKTIEVKEKDKEAYMVFLTFDLANRQIRIEEPIPFNEENHVYEFNYFGNNSAAGLQYYVTRDVAGSLHYLLTSTLNDLAIALQRNGLHQGDLYAHLRSLEENGLVILGTNKGQGSVDLKRFANIGASIVEVDGGKKKMILDGNALSFEQFVFRALGFDGKLPYQFVLITPRIITMNQETVVIAQHPDFIAVTKLEQKLETGSSPNQTDAKYCYVCHEIRPDASSSLTTKFSRSGINKIFTTTTINASKQINPVHYDDNYAICTNCFQKLLFGEQAINRLFQGRIAGERTFIIPEGLEGQFEYHHLHQLKEKLDLAFSTRASENWLNELESEQEEALDGSEYLVHFIIYRTDGNSVSILEAFEDVPILHIRKVIDTMADHAHRLQSHLRGLKLDDIYRLITVHTNKNGDQLDVHRVLSVYKSLLCKYRMDSQVLIQYALEALDKGLKQLAKEQSNQFPNMRLNWFKEKTDFYIRHIVMKYIALIHTFQTLGLLEQEAFDAFKEVAKLEAAEEKRDLIAETEQFLDDNGFTREQRGLFYLGALINKIGLAQYHKEHKHKPILNKIQYQGMNRNEVLRLHLEVCEKVTQYARGENSGWRLDCERLMERFCFYTGNPDSQKWLSEQHNVFFIMSGYSYMVRYYSNQELQDAEANEENEEEEDSDD
jgi:CRISPR-associated protein Csh1